MSENKETVNLRQIVLEILLQVTEKKEFGHIVIRNTLNKYNYLETAEKSFIKRLSEGTLERMTELDYILNLYSKTKTQAMKPVIRNILRMAVYQMLYMDGVYDTKACNEAVKLTQKKGFQGLKGYVNGVLRTVSREKERITYPDEQKEPILFLSVTYSMPIWLIEMWEHQYGLDTTKQMLVSQLKERAVTIRILEHMDDCKKQDLLKEIADRTGTVPILHPYLPYAYMLKGTDNVRELPGFGEGQYYVQDVSSMLVAQVADLKGGETVLDVCAAPGGKTLHIADKLNHTGRVEARDLSANKVAMIEENVRKSDYCNITYKIWDATMIEEEQIQQWDVVLADVPCSGLGVIGKKSDIKYRTSPERLRELVALQRSILETIQLYVKPGGTLIYSTCTVNKEENEENAAWFTEHFPFERLDIKALLPELLRGYVGADESIQLIPGVMECDGFFIAKFKRKSADIED